MLGLDPEALESVSVSVSSGTGDLPPVVFPSSPGSRTDREGRYKITDLAPGEWRVVAQARGRAIQEPLQIAPGAREAVLDLRFSTGFTIIGRVTADHAPLAGAQVSASSNGGSFQAQTGPDGGFQIPNVPPGRYPVMAMDQGGLGTSATVEVTGDQEVNLDFTTGGLRVTVLAGGAPVANAFIHLSGSVPIFGRGRTTDAAGNFEAPRLTSGTYTVRPGGGAEVEIELKPAP